MAEELGALAQLLESGVASRALPGETISGDQAVMNAFPGGVLVGVVDALGHGKDAAATASRAVAVIRQFAHHPLAAIVQRCHQELRGTRGAVMSVASFSPADATMTWLGVGNVEGVLIPAHAGTRHTTLVSRPGIVGGELPRISPWIVPLGAGDTLIFSTDGIAQGFASGLTRTGSAQQLADSILAHHAKPNDDALVMVVRYRGEV